jgi:predicted ribosomally synthesized peptide with nif11-like leader
MSTSDAEAFLHRLESDETFAERMQAASGDPDTAHRLAADAGYSFTHEDMLEAMGNVYGIELSLEQLEQIAAGNAGAVTLGPSATTPLLGIVAMGAAAG